MTRGAYSVTPNFLASVERVAALPQELHTSVGETPLISLLLSGNSLTAGNRVLAKGEGTFRHMPRLDVARGRYSQHCSQVGNSYAASGYQHCSNLFHFKVWWMWHYRWYSAQSRRTCTLLLYMYNRQLMDPELSICWVGLGPYSKSTKKLKGLF